VGCPLLSTLVRSRGSECIALNGSGAAAGLFEVPFELGFERVGVALLFVPLAGEARIVELEANEAIGVWTILRWRQVGLCGLCVVADARGSIRII